MMSSQNQISIEPNAYVASAVLAKEVGEQMLSRLEWMTWNPQVIVDMGCGPGNFTQQLGERYKEACVIGIDWANPMLNFAKQQAQCKVSWICADTFTLPLRDHSVDLIFANLLLPWCHDVNAVYTEWRRVLKPDGVVMFSSFGPDTLLAMREGIKAFLLPNLIDMHLQGDALLKARFMEPVLDVEHITLQYHDMQTLLKELQDTAILCKNIPDNLASDLQAQWPNAPWQVTYEIVYGLTFGSPITAEFTADDTGTVRIPLHYLRGLNRP